MLHTYLYVTALLTGLRSRISDTSSSDDGFTLLGWVVIALGAFLAAGAAVIVIGNAITSRTSAIS